MVLKDNRGDPLVLYFSRRSVHLDSIPYVHAKYYQTVISLFKSNTYVKHFFIKCKIVTLYRTDEAYT
ncbi:hypothetical protein VNO77_18576 [Canavalia gladiata]|uniref:Uncharacterized protein n=1 Tax=Canavalia gladiata TaxID=3824 RepID=A0AAN9QJS1_CANGL